ncbi:MAG: hypothetical protein JOZ32_14175 [Bryobacterales bacterium]|nr:hypothetical protein [Bryobacterales bacterium]
MHANRLKTCSLWFALAWPAFAAGPALVVDRGLPQANLNNTSGDFRSNVRWSSYDSGFLGDDFTIGAAGESWVIDTIRVWTVPGVNKVDPDHLGDFYQDVRLYFGGSEDGLSPIVTGLLTAGSNQSNTANILISDATAGGAVPYDDFGTNMRIWQIDFTQLNLNVQGGVKYRFGAWGLGRTVPDDGGKTYAWFNAASHAPLAVAKQDGADGEMLLFSSGGKFESTFDGKGAGWDKTSDIDVQVFGHRADAQ